MTPGNDDRNLVPFTAFSRMRGGSGQLLLPSLQQEWTRTRLLAIACRAVELRKRHQWDEKRAVWIQRATSSGAGQKEALSAGRNAIELTTVFTEVYTGSLFIGKTNRDKMKLWALLQLLHGEIRSIGYLLFWMHYILIQWPGISSSLDVLVLVDGLLYSS